MRKLIFTVLFSVFALTLFAQSEQTYKLGDLIEKDGIKAVVVYVDESGQHGLMLSPRAYLGDECFKNGQGHDFKKMKETAQKRLETMLKIISPTIKKLSKKECKQTGDDFKVVYEKNLELMRDTLKIQLELIDMLERMPRLTCSDKENDICQASSYDSYLKTLVYEIPNSEYGKENTQAIFDYCLKNNISMQEYFPAYYWVSQLGEDWFIPGTHELELFGSQFVDKLGVGMGNSNLNTEKAMQQLSVYNYYKRNWSYLGGVYPTRGEGTMLDSVEKGMVIRSSTMSETIDRLSKENKGKYWVITDGSSENIDFCFYTLVYGQFDYGYQCVFQIGVPARYYAMAEF